MIELFSPHCFAYRLSFGIVSSQFCIHRFALFLHQTDNCTRNSTGLKRKKQKKKKERKKENNEKTEKFTNLPFFSHLTPFLSYSLLHSGFGQRIPSPNQSVCLSNVQNEARRLSVSTTYSTIQNAFPSHIYRYFQVLIFTSKLSFSFSFLLYILRHLLKIECIHINTHFLYIMDHQSQTIPLYRP